MRAGILRSRVTLQRRVSTQNEVGELVSTWADIASVWANVRHPSGMEVSRSGVPVSAVKTSIRIRWREDIDATCRVVHGEKLYNIQAVLPSDETREYVDLACEQGQNDG